MTKRAHNLAVILSVLITVCSCSAALYCAVDMEIELGYKLLLILLAIMAFRELVIAMRNWK